MKNYSSTPAKWLSLFVYFMIGSLVFCIIVISFTNHVDKIKIGDTNFQYPIQTKSYVSKFHPMNDSLFAKIKKTQFNTKNENEFNADLFKVQLDYKLDKKKYSTLHLSYKILFICFLFVIIYQLNLFRKVLKNFRMGNPFEFQNVKLLRKGAYIGLIMIALEAMFSIIEQFLIGYLFSYKMFFTSNPFPEFFSVNLMSVIFFFTVAEILKMGINYKKENELTV